MTDLPCSLDAADEPLAGTAPLAQAWVVLEQPGPWGRQALLDSRLDPDVGEALLTAASGTGTTLLLARHPDRLERRGEGDGRRIWVAHTAPGRAFLRTGTITDPADLLAWDFTSIGAGALPPVGQASPSPVTFVCTHSGRDACCATHGRALLTALMARTSDRSSLWECSHLGGHRFAPTALVLPSGLVYGRLDVPTAEAIARRTPLDALRGRSFFPAPMQVAEIAVRRVAEMRDTDVLDVLWVRGERCVPVDPGVALESIASMLAEVRHEDGRAWRVPVRELPLEHPRRESCGREQVSGATWHADEVVAVADWR